METTNTTTKKPLTFTWRKGIKSGFRAFTGKLDSQGPGHVVRIHMVAKDEDGQTWYVGRRGRYIGATSAGNEYGYAGPSKCWPKSRVTFIRSRY
jgi:hypothetical protein